MDNFELKKTAFVALAIHNLNTNNNYIYRILIEESKRIGPVDLNKNECFYNREYRTLAAVCASLISKSSTFIYLNHSFSELILNGMSFIGTRKFKANFFRNNNCRSDEIFYSKLFELINDFTTEPSQIISSIDLNDKSIHNLYSAAANIFYLSLYFIFFKDKLHKTSKVELIEEISEYLYKTIEIAEKMIENYPSVKIVLNYSLISLSIIKNSSFDLNLLRILRRQILMTKDLKNLTKSFCFDTKKKDMNAYYFRGFESMQIYKQCVGLVCCGLGFKKLDEKDPISLIKVLIASFFVKENNLQKFEVFDMLKFLVINFCEENQSFTENFRSVEKSVKNRRNSKKMMKIFFDEFNSLSEFDKKVVLDILSDYYENYFTEDSLFDLKCLSELINSIK